MAEWRLLVHAAADGAWNMAVDEAMLEACAAGEPAAPPTLRLYAWKPWALSLGRGQPTSWAPEFLRERGIDLVRRPTGGRAVLHGAERTYAVTGRLNEPAFAGGVIATYGRISTALVEALGGLGLAATAGREPVEADRTDQGPRSPEPACFATTSVYEIEVGGRKLVGSAQLRRRRAFLQHGSIPWRSDPALLGQALGQVAPAGGWTDLERLSLADDGELERALTRAFERRFSVSLVPGVLTPFEQERAEQLRCWKYDSAAWTLDGKLGPRERAWGPVGS